MASFKEDTQKTKVEFESLSNSTQIFIWSMVAIGVLIGLVLGGAIGYGVAVEEHEGRQCIEYEDEQYCLDESVPPPEEDEGEDG